MAKFPDRLKELRIKNKLTQQELADRVGVNRVTYTNWENGKREPELDKVIELATELHSSLDYLLGKEENNVLDLTPEKVSQMKPDEMEQVQKELMHNFMSIFEVGKKKFGTSDEEMEYIKAKIFHDLLNDKNPTE